MEVGISAMTRSGNSFAKVSVTKGSGSFTGDITPSSNVFAADSFQGNTKAWEGDNLTSDALFDDVLSGTPFGIGEFGGLAHFKNVTQPTISH